MREIKYKFWDSLKEKWFEPTYEAYRGNLFDLYLSKSGKVISRGSELGGDTDTIELSNEIQERFIPVFYTGLKDKNGKEIYESDIVKTDDGDVGCVEVMEGCFSAFCECMGEYQWREYEIIGNIYENHNLLEQGN